MGLIIKKINFHKSDWRIAWLNTPSPSWVSKSEKLANKVFEYSLNSKNSRKTK